MLQTIALYVAVAVLAIGALLAIPWRALLRGWSNPRAEAAPRPAQVVKLHHASASHSSAAIQHRPAMTRSPTLHPARGMRERSRQASRHTLHRP